ncbi:hypothetical protein BH09PAT3_BH09PAT3_2300 [soil metagenome]
MPENKSDRRLAENEVIFRQINEQLQNEIDSVNQLADEDGQPEHHIVQSSDDAPLSFFCECSDEKCTQRLLVNHQDYNEIHKNRSRFVIKNGHQVVAIEKVIKTTEDYMIVEKNIPPPASGGSLNTTELDNAGEA